MADPGVDDAPDTPGRRPPSAQATADADPDEKAPVSDADSAVPSRQESKIRDPDAAPSRVSQVWRWAPLLLPLAGIGLCVPLWLVTDEWGMPSEGGPGPAFYPRLLIGLFAFCMAVRLVQEIATLRRGVVAVEDEEAIPEEGAELETDLISARRVAIVVAISLAYVVGTTYLGWVIATFLVVVVFLVLAGKRNLLIVVPLAAALSIGFAYMFVKVVYLSLPTGVGFFDNVSVRLFELLGAY